MTRITRAEIVEAFNKFSDELGGFCLDNEAIGRIWDEHPKLEHLRKLGDFSDMRIEAATWSFSVLVNACTDEGAWRAIRSMVTDELIAEGIIERKGEASE